MSEQSPSNWSQYRTCAILNQDEACRTIVAANDAGERILIHEVSFSSGTPSAVRMRLEYETAQLASLSLDRMTLPLDFEFMTAMVGLFVPGQKVAHWPIEWRPPICPSPKR